MTVARELCHVGLMRIHLQNPPGETLFSFSEAMWAEAADRAGLVGAGHTVSIGTTATDFAEAMLATEALIADAGVIRALLPFHAPQLKLISATNAGLDSLAPYDWLPRDAVLLNNRGAHTAKSGEFGVMALLMLANRVPQMVTQQRQGVWRALWGNILAGRALTVVGLGTLGGAVAAQAAHFGMMVTGVRANPAAHPNCARVVGSEALDEVLPATEFLVLACPLTAATRNLLDRRRIALLPAGAGVINIGRGALVDQEALCDRLDAGTLCGAVLDVFTPEPIPKGHRLWSTRDLIISPHTSADDPNTYNPISLDIFFDNLRAWQEERPLPNRFDIQRGY
jgi:glyoxylate/hydroxypyruvate reductase